MKATPIPETVMSIVITAMIVSGAGPDCLMAADVVTVREVKKLMMTPGEEKSLFGVGSRVSGDILVSGAMLADRMAADSGTAFIFGRNQGGGDNWGLLCELAPSGLVAGDLFGQESDVSGDLVAVSTAPHHCSTEGSGSVHLFQKDLGGPDNWGLAHRVVPSDPTSDKVFGHWNALDLKEGILAVGATRDNERGIRASAVHIFYLRPTPRNP